MRPAGTTRNRRREPQVAGIRILAKNAHIQDDLPCVLAALGLVDSDRTVEERAMVTAEVEAHAASQALLLRRATAYLPTLQSRAAR